MRIVALGLGLGLALASVAGAAEHTRVTNPTVLGAELLGRGGAWSVFFDRVVTDDLAAGFGFSVLSLSSGRGVPVVPAYLNYYLTREAGSIFGTAGVTVVTDTSLANGRTSSTGGFSLGSSAVVPTIGVGYENRGDSGFLFRVTGYGIIAAQFAGWVGFSFGYAF